MIKPDYFWLNITEYCNNKCLWCYEQGNQHRYSKMSLEVSKIIIDAMEDAGVKECTLIGGEPLLHPEIWTIVQYLKNKGFLVSLISNGRLLSNNKVVSRLNESGIDNISISIHGWSKETYNKFALSTSGFIELKKCFENLNKYNIPYSASIVLSNYTKNELKNIVQFIEDNNIKYLHINIGMPSIGGSVNSDFVIPLGEQAKEIVLFSNHLKNLDVNVSINLTTPHCLFEEKDRETLINNDVQFQYGCSMRNGSGVVFKVDGGISTCNHFLDYEILPSSEIFDILKNKKFLSFWNDQIMKSIRKEVSYYFSKECETCEAYEQCGGGCPINWMAFDPENSGLNAIKNLF